MEGLRNLATEPSHRKELVAGNIDEYITSRMSTYLPGESHLMCPEPEFRESAQRVGDDAGEFRVLHQIHSMKKRLSIVPILRDAMHELPQVVEIDLRVDEANQIINQIAFALRAAQKPMTIPLSLASLALIEHASTLFMSTHFSTYGGPTIAMHFSNVRDLYETENVQNKVTDGTELFPSLRTGMSVEFRYLHYSLLHVGVSNAYNI